VPAAPTERCALKRMFFLFSLLVLSCDERITTTKDVYRDYARTTVPEQVQIVECHTQGSGRDSAAWFCLSMPAGSLPAWLESISSYKVDVADYSSFRGVPEWWPAEDSWPLAEMHVAEPLGAMGLILVYNNSTSESMYVYLVFLGY
jgi:hypothetical protein